MTPLLPELLLMDKHRKFQLGTVFNECLQLTPGLALFWHDMAPAGSLLAQSAMTDFPDFIRIRAISSVGGRQPEWRPRGRARCSLYLCTLQASHCLLHI